MNQWGFYPINTFLSFQLIMNPSRQDINVKTVYAIMILLWILGFTLSTPIGVFARVTTASGYPICSEATLDDNMRITKLVYSILSMILLYGTPVTLVSIAYVQICIRVNERTKNKSRISNQKPTGTKSAQIQHEVTECSDAKDSYPNPPMPTSRVSDVGPVCSYFFKRKFTYSPANMNLPEQRTYGSHRRTGRHRQTSFLLAGVTLFFAISWLPINIVNLLLDLRELNFEVIIGNSSQDKEDSSYHLPFVTPAVTETASSIFPSASNPGSLNRGTILITQAICLLCVLISACINPMLYGWLNENFRHRFKLLLRCHDEKRYSARSETQRSQFWQAHRKRSPYAFWPSKSNS